MTIAAEIKTRSPKIFCWAVGVFIVSLLWGGAIKIRSETLLKERDLLYSFTNIVTSSVQSFVDGLTFGAFRDDGIFAELEELERKENSLSRRAAALRIENNFVGFIRWVSLLAAIGTGVVLWREHGDNVVSELKALSNDKSDQITTGEQDAAGQPATRFESKGPVDSDT